MDPSPQRPVLSQTTSSQLLGFFILQKKVISNNGLRLSVSIITLVGSSNITVIYHIASAL